MSRTLQGSNECWQLSLTCALLTNIEDTGLTLSKLHLVTDTHNCQLQDHSVIQSSVPYTLGASSAPLNCKRALTSSANNFRQESNVVSECRWRCRRVFCVSVSGIRFPTTVNTVICLAHLWVDWKPNCFTQPTTSNTHSLIIVTKRLGFTCDLRRYGLIDWLID